MGNDEVVLVDFNLSMFCVRVKIALAEKGVEFENREEDLENTKNMQVHEVAKRMWTGKRGEHEEDKKELVENLKQLEEALGDMPYFGGQTFGFVDIALIPFYKWFSIYEKIGNFKLNCPKLTSWANRCLVKQTVSKFVSDEKDVYDFVIRYRKTIGVD
ncbi:glutathione S-transferase [Vigna angularis]|uniref:glutathione transferase n=1 Tax=Phaseolus angularis TaxID=3914 RepID=A0A8T0LAZ5_PHAAN|nr:glutathione S-transferase [Vigna angularis]